jgi:hypothetical protein
MSFLLSAMADEIAVAVRFDDSVWCLRLDRRSCLKRQCQVTVCEGRGVKLPGATCGVHLVWMRDEGGKIPPSAPRTRNARAYCGAVSDFTPRSVY